MELTMTNGFGFCELNENEMMLIDGGFDGAQFATGCIACLLYTSDAADDV